MRNKAKDIVKKLQDNGFEAYFAGGAVRDLLLNKSPKDIDIVSSAHPEQIENLFPKNYPIGKQFGIILVNIDNTNFEVATFRSEDSYEDNRRPSKVVFSDAKSDALRRDFTINGIFYDPIKNKFIDYVGGEEDVKKRVINFIGDAQERIDEDSLRLVRAIRFKITLGFQYGANTFEAIRKSAGYIKNVSKERLRDELKKILSSPFRHIGLVELSESGILKYLLPEIELLKGVPQPVEYHHEGDVFTHTYLALKSLREDASEHVAWAVLLHDIAKPQTLIREGERIIFHDHAKESAKLSIDIMNRLKFSNIEKETIAWLIGNHMKIGDIDKMRPSKRLNFVLDPRFPDLIKVANADAQGTYPVNTSLVQKLKQDLENAISWKTKNVEKQKNIVSGDDIVKLGIEPSKIVEVIIEDVSDKYIAGELSDKDAAIEYIKDKYIKNENI